jgi:RNA polymerase sigma-70 factor (ECF subfamily)
MQLKGQERFTAAVSEPSADNSCLVITDEQLAACVQTFRPQLTKVCQRILGELDSALDAVSETYLRAHRGRADFDGVNIHGWLLCIARRVCLDRLRREVLYADREEGVDPASTDSEMRLLTALQIRSILADLSDEQRRCLKLFYIEGYSMKELAKATGFSEKQVKSFLQNGRRNFIRAWKAMEDLGER